MNNTLHNGMQVLEHLSQHAKPQKIADVADQLGMGRSMVHRLLQSWVDLGYVSKNDNSEYSATLKLWEIGMQLITQLDVRVAARPIMSELVQQTGETVQLSVRQQLDVVYIETIESQAPVRSAMKVGARAPAHCAATGKIMLAFSDYPSILANVSKLPRFTEHTITETSKLCDELQKARQQGYALNRGEWRTDVRGLATPVFNAAEEIVAALGISAPASRLKPAGVRKHLPHLIRAAKEISRSLGYEPAK